MKNLNEFVELLGLASIAFVCCLFLQTAVSADMVSNAGLIPAGYGYTHGRIPVVETKGRPEIHDAAIMRYDKNSRIKDIDEVSTQYNENYTRQDAPQQGNNRQQF